LADLGKIRQGLPKLASCEFAANQLAYFKMRHLFIKICRLISKFAGMPWMLQFGLNSRK
jgi:hypothetical protein